MQVALNLGRHGGEPVLSLSVGTDASHLALSLNLPFLAASLAIERRWYGFHAEHYATALTRGWLLYLGCIELTGERCRPLPIQPA